jgi:hypothetical protein
MVNAMARHSDAALESLQQVLQIDKRNPACRLNNYKLLFSKIGSASDWQAPKCINKDTFYRATSSNPIVRGVFSTSASSRPSGAIFSTDKPWICCVARDLQRLMQKSKSRSESPGRLRQSLHE